MKLEKKKTPVGQPSLVPPLPPGRRFRRGRRKKRRRGAERLINRASFDAPAEFPAYALCRQVCSNTRSRANAIARRVACPSSGEGAGVIYIYTEERVPFDPRESGTSGALRRDARASMCVYTSGKARVARRRSLTSGPRRRPSQAP